MLAVPAALTAPHHPPSAPTVWAMLLLGAACTGIAFIAFFSLIHVPREHHGASLRRIASWLRPGGSFVGMSFHQLGE